MGGSKRKQQGGRGGGRGSSDGGRGRGAPSRGGRGRGRGRGGQGYYAATYEDEWDYSSTHYRMSQNPFLATLKLHRQRSTQRWALHDPQGPWRRVPKL